MEVLFEALFEFALQIVLELLVEFGLRRAGGGDRKPVSPWLAAVGYVLLGVAVGWVSVLVFPTLFLQSPAARWANLLLAPIAAGAVMALLGSWRRRKGQRLVRLDTFAYGYLFAVAMAVTRVALGDG